MGDLEIRNRIDAKVDGNGDATFRRTWELTNSSESSLNLSLRFFVNITSKSLTDFSLSDDDSGTSLKFAADTEDHETAIKCDFDKTLSTRERYELYLSYRHPQYFVRFPLSDTWLMTEYFQRNGKLTDVVFSENEDQHFDFSLSIDDPRPSLLGIRNPFIKWTTEVTPQSSEKRLGHSRMFHIERGLGPTDRSEDFHFLSALNSRSFATAAVVFLVSTALGSFVTWLLPALPL